MSEGLVRALLGAVLGSILSVFYTQLVFRVLNTLWYDIVRTNVLEISVLPTTVLMGFVISVVVSLAAIFMSVRRFQKKQISDLQKSLEQGRKQKLERIYSVLMWVTLVTSLGIMAWQLALPQPRS